MGTRSDIIALVSKSPEVWARIYCHWDGYPEHNGAILFSQYQDPKKIKALMALGDLSSLGPQIGKKHDFDTRDEGACTAYGRDRGEKNVAAKKFSSLAAAWPGGDTGTEYTYVWDGAKWWVGDPDEGVQSMKDLAALLRGDEKLATAVKAFGGNFVIGQHTGDLDKDVLAHNLNGVKP